MGSFKLVIYGLSAENVSCVRLLIISSQFSLVSPTETSLVYLTFLFSLSLSFCSTFQEIFMSLCSIPHTKLILTTVFWISKEPFLVLCMLPFIYTYISSFFMDLDPSKNHYNRFFFFWTLYYLCFLNSFFFFWLVLAQSLMLGVVWYRWKIHKWKKNINKPPFRNKI